MEIKILGHGSATCKRLYAEAERAIERTEVEANLCKIERIDDIVKYGVVMTPALIIDGEVKCMGQVPSSEEIVSWIQIAAAREQRWGPVNEHYGDPV
ncbi:MAG TPA: thioredoxin family protein [bacterium]